MRQCMEGKKKNRKSKQPEAGLSSGGNVVPGPVMKGPVEVLKHTGHGSCEPSYS